MDTSENIHFGMKKLSLQNWREADVPRSFPGLTEELWVEEVLAPQLSSSVPEDVLRLFEIARGSILYGWLFYPLLTLASEQLYRVQEAAVRARCKLAGIPTAKTLKNGSLRNRKFSELIDELANRDIIRNDELGFWDAVRHSRNQSSHPDRPTILPPGHAIAATEATARRINQIFDQIPDYHSVLGQSVRLATGIGFNRNLPIVVGIDVGDENKGFHLVALRETVILGQLQTTDPRKALEWCLEVDAKIIGVDAPSGWCNDIARGRREAEAILALQGYSSFPTPTRDVAASNPFNGWMFSGERLYIALREEFPLFDGQALNGRFCFETYPYVSSCGLSRRRLEAKNKLHDRRDIIRSAGIEDQTLSNGDYVDAAICAMTAFSVFINYAVACGNSDEGFIVAPCFY